MATALDYITRAMKLANILGEGQSPSAEQGQNGLDTLNDMLQAWSLDSLTVYQTTNDQVSLVPAQSVYTIGIGGNFNLDRPVQINSAYVDYQGISYPVNQINQDEYNLITLKSMTQPLPRMFLYVNTDPLGTLTLWPVPNQALTFTISVDRILSVVASLATTMSFPPGYAKLIRSHLAVELCTEYGRDPPPSLQKQAQEAIASVKKANRTQTVAEYDSALIGPPSGLAGFLGGYY
jgi:hypothetical protein